MKILLLDGEIMKKTDYKRMYKKTKLELRRVVYRLMVTEQELDELKEKSGPVPKKLLKAPKA